MNHDRAVKVETRNKKYSGIDIRVIATSYFLIAALVGLLVYRHGENTVWFFREDGPVETLTCLLLFVSSGIMLQLAWQRRGQAGQRGAKWSYLLLGLLFLVAAMEEISWGQRIFHYQIDFIQKASTQDETNLHNLKIFQNLRQYSPWLEVISHPDRMFTVFMFALTTLLPIVNALSTPVHRLLSRIQFPVTAWTVSLSCLLSFVIPEVFDVASKSPLVHHLSQELQESLFALTLLFFSLYERHCHAVAVLPEVPEPVEMTVGVADSDPSVAQ